MFDWYIEQPVAKPRSIVACKDVYLSVELFSLFSKLIGAIDTPQFNTTYPGDQLPPYKYDVIILTFEPMSSEEQRWYHEKLLTLLAPGGKVITCV